MNKAKYNDLIELYHNEGLLIADGFDEACIGVTCGINPVIVYSYDQCVNILIERDGMTREDAIEYMEFNVVCAYVGEKTPIFITECEA